MDKLNLLDSFLEFKETKGINREILIELLEKSMRQVINKRYGGDSNYDIILNPNNGDLEIWRNREVVKDDCQNIDKNKQIILRETIGDFEIGEEYTDEFKLSDFGRRNIQFLKEVLFLSIKKLDREKIYKKYQSRIGCVFNGQVHRISKYTTTLLDDGFEMILNNYDKLPGDRYKIGDNVKAIIQDVVSNDKGVSVKLSRTSPEFLRELLKSNINEINDGLITIKSIYRNSGLRSKVLIESYDDRIDAIATCVGKKGYKIADINKELKGESIDFILYTKNTELLTRRIFNGVKLDNIHIDELDKKIKIKIKPSDMSMLIGKSGSNINLAKDILGYEIDLYTTDFVVDDVILDEFIDEIKPNMLEQLKNIGCVTAKDVLKLPIEDISTRTNLEIETINHILKILKSEFQ